MISVSRRLVCRIRIVNLGLKGRIALVTGASKGIGKAIARGLADEGVNLVLLARGVEELEQAAAEICKATGVRVVAVPTDMRDTAAVKAAADRAASEFRTRSHPRQQRRRTDQASGTADHLARHRLDGRREHQDDGHVADDSGVAAEHADGRDRPHHQHQRHCRLERAVLGADAWAEQLGDESRDDLPGAGSVGVSGSPSTR